MGLRGIPALELPQLLHSSAGRGPWLEGLGWERELDRIKVLLASLHPSSHQVLPIIPRFGPLAGACATQFAVRLPSP